MNRVGKKERKMQRKKISNKTFGEKERKTEERKMQNQNTKKE